MRASLRSSDSSSASRTCTRKRGNRFNPGREIQENREQTTEAMNKVHKTLNEFQEEFQQRLLDLGNSLHSQIDEEASVFRKQWKFNHERM